MFSYVLAIDALHLLNNSTEGYVYVYVYLWVSLSMDLYIFTQNQGKLFCILFTTYFIGFLFMVWEQSVLLLRKGG